MSVIIKVAQQLGNAVQPVIRRRAFRVQAHREVESLLDHIFRNCNTFVFVAHCSHQGSFVLTWSQRVFESSKMIDSLVGRAVVWTHRKVA